MTTSDQEALERLVDVNDPDGVMHRSDVYVLGASTVHVGTTP